MRRANARGVRRGRSQPASPQLLCLALSCACGLAAASADILGSGANSRGKHHRGGPTFTRGRNGWSVPQ